ncbi:MAG: Fic family protein [Ignavibacteriaceae bacterium]|jgi:Fic family protein
MDNEFIINTLPPKFDFETTAILKQLAVSHRYLAELKGVVTAIPNETILINTLALQEAKDSSAVENIITTHDELYKAGLLYDFVDNASAKEVYRYASALKKGFDLVRINKILTTNIILQIQEELENNTAGFRKLPGTVLKNEFSGEVVYTPPQDPQTIISLMQNMDEYINNDSLHTIDPLIKMAIIHYQFESIHPFYDGNGRTGRIINILYLVIKDLLNLPVLYLSRYIITNKNQYYKLLQQVRISESWEPWILYMLKGVEETSLQTISLIQGIKELMMEFKHKIRNELPKIYSQDFLNNLFRHPYTKIEFLMRDLNITRITATKYLNLVTKIGFLEKKKIGRTYYYVNRRLFELFINKTI